MRFAQPPAVEDDSVARLPLRMGGGFYGAGKIDPGDHRKAPNDRRLASHRKPILVVHRRPFDTDGDIALCQVGFLEIGKTDLLSASILLDYNGLESRHAPLIGWPVTCM